MPVLSLPSENAPAPPSPNCTLDCSSKMPCARILATSLALPSTSRPRSSNSGCRPALAKINAANKPAGPPPTTTGRSSAVTRGTVYSNGLASVADGQRAISACSSPDTATSTVSTKQTAFFLRASTARRTMRQSVMARSGTRRCLDAARLTAASV